jgi:hypothetical protein
MEDSLFSMGSSFNSTGAAYFALRPGILTFEYASDGAAIGDMPILGDLIF